MIPLVKYLWESEDILRYSLFLFQLFQLSSSYSSEVTVVPVIVVGWLVGWLLSSLSLSLLLHISPMISPLFCRPAGWPLPSQQWRELPRGSVVDGWQHGANTENGKTVEVWWVGSSPKYRQDMVIHGDATFNNECDPFWVAF